MKNLFGFTICFIALAGCVSSPAVSADSIELVEISLEEYSEHLMHYFENKNDDIIYETISVYDDENNIPMLDRIDSIVIFFFYGIKTENQNKYNNFSEIVLANKNERLINVFRIIDRTDITEYIERQEASPDLNDVYWTLFFSTGNLQYLDRLFNTVMTYCNETENVNYYMAARSAIRSIFSNMLTYSQIKEYVLQNTILNNEMKEYILNNDPNKIQVDTMNFINIQRKNGIW
jgi:hypothetical protein